jgi:hypothetical protein
MLEWEELVRLADNTDQSPDWIITSNIQDETESENQVRSLIEILGHKGLRAAIMFTRTVEGNRKHYSQQPVGDDGTRQKRTDTGSGDLMMADLATLSIWSALLVQSD